MVNLSCELLKLEKMYPRIVAGRVPVPTSLHRIMVRNGRDTCKNTKGWTEDILRALRRELTSKRGTWRDARDVLERHVLDDVFSSGGLTGERERCIGARNYNGRRALLLKGSSNPLQFTLATFYQTWKCSKTICPSAGYAGPFARKLSHSTTNIYFNGKNPACRKFSSRGDAKKGLLCGTTASRSDHFTFCDKTSTSNGCHGRTTSVNRTTTEDGSSDVSSSFPIKCNETACTSSTKDLCGKPCLSKRPPPRFYSPCPNVDDYCVTEALPVGRRQAHPVPQSREKSNIPSWIRSTGPKRTEDQRRTKGLTNASLRE
ncbi:uncharacterized protein LOC143143330 isoform X2 [Ptiloglossa arizonensis]|uniref:uncharacterized protein LOC143143330 isoform X2 n=1 Tax=Ptiloglossa arizonensis TaxID=3350558 RepID=UPI003FA128F5